MRAELFSRIAGLREQWGRGRGMVRSVVAVAGGNSLATALGAIGGILVARFVAPETVGRYRAYTIPLMYLTFLQLGTFEGLIRQIPLHVGRNRKDLAEDAAASAASWNMVLSVIMSASFVLVGLITFGRGDAWGALGWATQGVIVWGVFYGGYLAATYRTLDNFVSLARVQVAQAFASFALVFTLPFLGFAGLCLRAAVPSLAGTWMLHRLRPLRVTPSRARRPFIALIRVGFPFYFWGALYTSLWIAVENTLVFAFAGTKGLGLFAVAVVLREAISTIPQAIHQVVTPRIVETYGRSGHLGTAMTFVYRLVPPMAVGMSAIVLLLSVSLNAIVPRVLPSYVEGLGLMKISLWFAVVQVIGLPLNALIATGNGWSYGRAILAGLITFPVATYLLVPYIGGVLAVAAGSLLGRVARTVVGYWELARSGAGASAVLANAIRERGRSGAGGE